MPIPYRSELRPFLEEFADHHRGVRLGQMFGLPAIYVGRRLVTCLIEDGIIVRLPDEAARRELKAKRAVPYSFRGKPMGTWVLYTPRSARGARALTPILEVAVRHMAERVTAELTGVTITRRTRR